jgi:hypothetical protein
VELGSVAVTVTVYRCPDDHHHAPREASPR